MPEVERIRFSLPNKHHLLYDLSRFGLENDRTRSSTPRPSRTG